MLVKELIDTLKTCNPEAKVVVCYEHKEKGQKPQCYYQEVGDIGYNQVLDKNKIVANENLLQIWCE